MNGTFVHLYLHSYRECLYLEFAGASFRVTKSTGTVFIAHFSILFQRLTVAFLMLTGSSSGRLLLFALKSTIHFALSKFCLVLTLFGLPLCYCSLVAKRIPWMELWGAGHLFSAFGQSLYLAVSRASVMGILLCIFFIQTLSLMAPFCTSVNRLTSFCASSILASSLLLHGGWEQFLYL